MPRFVRAAAVLLSVVVLTTTAALPARAATPVTITDAPLHATPGLPVSISCTLAVGAGGLYFEVDGQALPYDDLVVSHVGQDWTATYPGITSPGPHTLTVVANAGQGYVSTSTTVTVVDKTFADVPYTHVFLGPIEWLMSTGITTGYTDPAGRTFRPAQPVLREQMAAFLYRLVTLEYGAAPEVDVPEVSPFVDVPTSHTFYREIVWLESTGITTGYADPAGRAFRPSQPVLREQMAAFICRYDLQEPCADLGIDEPAIFADVPTSHTFFSAIYLLASLGITTGYEEPDETVTFRPSAPVLREQMAAFLYRYVSTWSPAA